MWVYRCFNGDLYCQGRKLERSLEKAHAGSEISFLFNLDEATVSISINERSYGVVFASIPTPVYPLVLFYNSQPPQRAVRLVSVTCQSNSVASTSLSNEQPETSSSSGSISLLIHHLSECISLFSFFPIDATSPHTTNPFYSLSKSFSNDSSVPPSCCGAADYTTTFHRQPRAFGSLAPC